MDSAETRSTTTRRRFLSLGTGLLLLALIAVVTGIALLPFYTATAEGAHRSVTAIEASVLLRTVRAAHHWASGLLVFLGVVYLVYGLLSSSYRRPLHLGWVAAVGLAVLFLLFQLTGHALPWDVHAVSSAAIEIGIAENVPVVGPMQGRLLRGGDAISGQTLTVWYIAHVALLPVGLLAMAGLFVYQLRRVGARLVIPKAPAAVVLGALLVAALAVPAPLGPAAGPADYASYASPPEWYVLAMHGLLKIAQSIGPSLTFIGSIVIPSLAVLWLLALPWLDRRTVDQPPSRVVAGTAAVGAAALLGLTLWNAGHMAPLSAAVDRPAPRAATAKTVSDTPLDPALIAKGKTVYEAQGCAACHKIAGQGGAVGPPLDGAGQRQPDLQWQIDHLKDPGALVKGSTMPPYKQLSEADLRALAIYMLSLK